jgi:uncharacterized protein (TIGR03437 family)
MMKYCAILLLTAGIGSAADFFNGQAARLVIGQPLFTSQNNADQDPNNPNTLAASQNLLGGAAGVAYGNNTLIVVDSNRVGATPVNNRVLIYRNINSQVPGTQQDIPQVDGSPCPACVGLPDTVVGQPDFSSTTINLAQNGMREPTAVATNGTMLAVADTNNNRVLLWKAMPSFNGAPADIVLGQADFTHGVAGTTATNMRGPQGVWVQGNRLFVADTQNHRVLIWNSIPTKNAQPADVVLGQPNFTSGFSPTTDVILNPQANNMSNPVSVTSDGTRLFVTDLGHSRVLIWNTMPSQNGAPADLAIGQPDLVSYIANNKTKLCDSNGTDSTTGALTYPDRCAKTLSFPRFALPVGNRLFVADGGNDRVMVYNTIPAVSGVAADMVLGQPADFLVDQVSDGSNPDGRASAEELRTPTALAWDGANLYVADPYNRRVMVFTIADTDILREGVTNDASRAVYAVGSVTFAGTITENDTVTIHVGPDTGGVDYTYKVVKDDTFTKIVNALVTNINTNNGGDPLVTARGNTTLNQIVFTAKAQGVDGNNVAYTTTVSTNATITATTGGSSLAGGQNAAKIGPGSLVHLDVTDKGIVDSTATVQANAQALPRELAGVKVFLNGIEAPLRSVSPTDVVAQLPFEVSDATSVNAFIRAKRSDGRIVYSTPIAVPVVPQNPGIYTLDPNGTDPRPGDVRHSSSYATGTISVDGTATAGDTATVVIEDRSYTYTVQTNDTLESIRDGLINLINADPKVTAYKAGVFTRIRLKARVPGPEGNGIPIGGSAGSSAQVIITATNTELCCANVAGAPVTNDNPALPGETVVVFSTGLGLVTPDEAQASVVTGAAYTGDYYNTPVAFVSSLAGGKTANVLYSGLKEGAIGIYEVHLELNSDLPTNPQTQLTIAQDVYVSNIIAFPVFNATPVAQ